MSLDIKNIKYFELHDFGMNDCTLQSDIMFQFGLICLILMNIYNWVFFLILCPIMVWFLGFIGLFSGFLTQPPPLI